MRTALLTTAAAAALTMLAGTTAAQYDDDRLCADQNRDGILGPSDFNAWILNFNNGSPDADLNGDGAVSASDFNAWILAYNQGSNGPTCDAGLASGFTATGRIAYPGDTDTFTIHADAGEDIRMTIAESSGNTGLYLYAAIYAPNGDLVKHNWDGYGMNLTAADVNQSGAYTILVRDYYEDATGDYTLTAIVPDDAVDVGNTPAPSGQTMTGAIGVGDIDTFTIDANAGEDIRITIAENGGNTGLYLYAAIYAPNGDLVKHNWDGFGMNITAADVNQNGTYTIVVQDYYGDSTGGYTFTAAVIDNETDADNTPLPSGETKSGTIEIGDIDTFTIDANAGEDIRMTIAENGGNTGLYLYAAIYAPSGDLVKHNWDGFGMNLTAADVGQNGTYTIVVQDYYGDSTGGYTLTAVVADDAVDADNAPLPSGVTLSRDLDLGDIDTFTIDANSGEDIRVALAESNGNTGFYPYAAIYAPNGDLVKHNWDGYGMNLTAADVNQNGTYTIVVQDYYGDSAGGYTLTAVVADDAVDAGNIALSSGAPASGSIGVGDIDTFTITAGLGSDIELSLTEPAGDTGLYLYAAIYAPNGNLVRSGWHSYAFTTTAANLPQAGVYTIVVQDFYGDSTGDYAVSATVLP